MTSGAQAGALPERGTYCIVTPFHGKERLLVGALGVIDFEPGLYAYVGSSRRNLRQRVARHLAPSKKARWHIDYVLLTPGHVAIEVAAWLSKPECEVAASLRRSSDGWIQGFGSSDCHCGSHLIYFATARRRSVAFRAASPDFTIFPSCRARPDPMKSVVT